VLLDVAGRCPDVLADPPPGVDFIRFGPSSLDLQLLVWIADPRLRESVTSALHFVIRAAFLDEGIEIPFPQYDLHFRADAEPRSEAVSSADRRMALGHR